MSNSCKASTAFRGAGNCVHKVPAKQEMILTREGYIPLKDFLSSVSSGSPIDPVAYYSMVGILKQRGINFNA